MGFLKYSPRVFFTLEPVEVLEIIKRAKERIKLDHELQYVAFSNALGKALAKGYKYFDIFEKETTSKKEVSEEEKEYLKDYFENW